MILLFIITNRYSFHYLVRKNKKAKNKPIKSIVVYLHCILIVSVPTIVEILLVQLNFYWVACAYYFHISQWLAMDFKYFVYKISQYFLCSFICLGFSRTRVKPLFFSSELTPLVWLKDETRPLCIFQRKTQLQFAWKSLRKHCDENVRQPRVNRHLLALFSSLLSI